MSVLLVLGYVIIVIVDFVPLYKQKIWKDFFVNTCFGIIAFTAMLLLCFGIKIPSPEAPIRNFITSIFGK